MTVTAPPSRWKVIFAFGLVYVFWGSTYLGIGIAVEQIPPAVMCATRFSIAGILMLAYCALTGRRIRFSSRQLFHFAAVGILLLMGGNLTLSYAELIVPTGLAALLVAVSPLWFLVLDSLLLGDHHISRRGKVGLAIGIAGMIVLIWPDLRSNSSLGHRELWWSLALLVGSFSWALGSVLSKKMADGSDRSIRRHSVANGLRRNRESDFCAARREAYERNVDASRSGRDSVSSGLRFMDRLHRLHLAPAARSHVKGVHLRLRQSRGRGVSGMAGSARTHRPLHRNRQRDHRGFGGAGNKREGLEASCGRRAPRGQSYGRLKPRLPTRRT